MMTPTENPIATNGESTSIKIMDGNNVAANVNSTNAILISDTQRNGSITGIGIVLGFSLTFAGQWSLGPGKWHYFSALALAIAFPGMVMQLRALFGILTLPLISIDEHQRFVKWFLAGMSLVLVGYVVNVLVGIAIDKQLFGDLP